MLCEIFIRIRDDSRVVNRKNIKFLSFRFRSKRMFDEFQNWQFQKCGITFFAKIEFENSITRFFDHWVQ